MNVRPGPASGPAAGASLPLNRYAGDLHASQVRAWRIVWVWQRARLEVDEVVGPQVGDERVIESQGVIVKT